jgi:hypothetical protein
MTEDSRTTESLLARRALAGKATPGPWEVDKSEITSVVYVETDWGHLICESDDEDAAHIAANSPDVVMSDIDEILRLRKKVEQLEKEADWLALVLANAGCGVPLTGYIDEDVNGMAPPAPEHWREAAREAVESSHEN